MKLKNCLNFYYIFYNINNNLLRVVFILKNNTNIVKNYFSNADIEYLSFYPDEKKFFFPLYDDF